MLIVYKNRVIDDIIKKKEGWEMVEKNWALDLL